ncbi:MAG: hypothetical protein ACXWAT_11215 [Methylobacter sp.]
MNTSEYIPYQSVSGIILKNTDYPEFPFLSGTGFFVHFPPDKNIFFITARHCVVNNDGRIKGDIRIPIHLEGDNNEAVPFSCYLETSYTDEPSEKEDVVVYVVDNISDENRDLLMKRALRLQHQDNVKAILDCIISSKGKIRTVGFPDVSKSIDYDANHVTFQPRGFHANLAGEGHFKNWYKIENGNWKEESLNGFSGSPILALCPTTQNEVLAIPIGILLTTSQFLSINAATNLIATYIIETQKANNSFKADAVPAQP